MSFLYELKDSDVSQSELRVLGWKKRGCETELDLCHVFVLIVKHFLNFTLENKNRTDRVY